jgi:ABC-2 type transport system permease protein
MRKILVVAAREFKAALRTKSFIISLLLMPVLMGASGGVQWILKKQQNIQEKRFAIVDRTPNEVIFPVLEKAIKKRNETAIFDPETKKQTKGVFILEKVAPQEDFKEQRLELSDLVRKDQYWGFVEIGPDALVEVKETLSAMEEGKASPPNKRRFIRYQTNHPTYEDFPSWVELQIQLAIPIVRTGLDPSNLKVPQPVPFRREGLSQRTSDGKIVDPKPIQQIARFLVPAGLVMLMFVVVMLGSTPAMQGVVEEKMQRIAEVLLGSLRPFELMFGKLLGLMGVSLTVGAVYLAGSYWAASQYGFAEYLSIPVLTWFIVFQALAVVMYGSLFLAIGAAATDTKETQTLVMPVMLLACIPMFILGTALEDPNNPLVVGVSFFPLSTPMLMMARVAISPEPPLWQPVLAAFLVLVATVGCVYAAGRIFRIGILMQGKGAKFSQLFQWVFRG